MQVRRPLAASLVLLAVLALPPLLGLAAHELAHWSEGAHGEATGGAARTGLGQVLVHGHGHAEEVPDHDHHLLPAPPLRPPAPLGPLDLRTPVPALRLAPDTDGLPRPDGRPWAWARPERSGSSPPRLHLLCALLI